MISESNIHRAANELIERYGANAMSGAPERVTGYSAKQDQLRLNVALRVLSAVELLLGGKAKQDKLHSLDGGSAGTG